jgi:AcrR family transcriptional regulator
VRADAQRNRARILAAAEEVFAERGPATSTEEVAARAGVAIGTIFRHFPTKDDLLTAIVKQLLATLTARVGELATDGDPATALFTFFTELVEQAAARKTVIDALAAGGRALELAPPLQTFRDAVGQLLDQGQRANAIRRDVQPGEVMALLLATTQGAVHGGWSHTLQERTLAVVFAGLQTPPRWQDPD